MDPRKCERRYDTVVVGGGPAGIFSAISIRPHVKSVALVEKNDRLGKKLLLSGSGQCNLTNAEPIDAFPRRYGKQGGFLKGALAGFDNRDLARFFKERGLDFEERDGGKLFPKTAKASDVLSVLARELESLEVDVFLNEKILSVLKTDGGFELRSRRGLFVSESLVLAAGGASYPSTGSSGDGAVLAKSLGHRIVPLRPALSPVVCRDFDLGGLAGLSFERAAVGLWREGGKIQTFTGPLLVTHDGFSGPVILNHSKDIRAGDRLVVNYLYPTERDVFEAGVIEGALAEGGLPLSAHLKGIGLNRRFSRDRLRRAGVKADLRLSELDKGSRRKLACLLTEDAFVVEKVKGFHIAMATAGGVSLKEVNRKSMGSKTIPGLYFAGEIMDIDGETGGYNLQAAFSTAAAIGRAFGGNRKKDL